MRWYRELQPSLPEELNGWLGLLTIPHAPPFPEELWGRKACGIMWCYTGSHDKAPHVLAPVREFGTPLLDGLQTMPYAALQSAFDALYPPGMQWYWLRRPRRRRVRVQPGPIQPGCGQISRAAN